MPFTSLAFCDAGFSYPDPEGAGWLPPAVEGVSFEVCPGEVTLLAGGSGCGKSTLLKMANGLIPHHTRGCQYGDVLLDGASVADVPLHETARRVGSVFQNPRTQMFNVEVRAELAFACENLGVDPDEIARRIERVSRAAGCEALLGRTVFELSGGERQKVACMCVSVLDPDVVVLDEPSSNLDMRAVEDLAGAIRGWKEAGKAVLMAEHRLYYLRDLVDHALFIRAGRVERSWDGAAFRRLTADETDELGLRRLHPETCVSADACVAGEEGAAASGGAAVSTSASGAVAPPRLGAAYVRDLACAYGKRRRARTVLDIPVLDLPLGVPVAVVGANGAGKSTLLRTLCGLAGRSGGTCQLVGAGAEPGADTATGPLDAAGRLARGFLVMQDVTRQLFCASAREEVALGRRGDAVEAGACAEAALAALDLADVADAHPLALSGGQQQRLAVACAVASERDIVLFDEPTSGLDLRHMREVAALVTRVAAGTSRPRLVAVVSHDYEFICACCRHAVQVEGGRVAASYRLDTPEGAARLRAFFWGAATSAPPIPSVLPVSSDPVC